MNGVDILRRAAREIRRDYGESWQKDSPDAKFHIAVADLLGAAAFGWDALDQHDHHALAVAQAYLGESK